MKISVIVPVRDEQESIRALLDSLLTQTLEPDEIIITDGGSIDLTPSIIDQYVDRGFPIQLIRSGPALPGRGRNLSAQRAAGEWLACIDAGIVPDSAWLQELLNSANREPMAQVVFGRYKPLIHNFFSECAAITYVVPRGNTAPSIASCLVKRSVWEEVGGFREDLRSGEDVIFIRELERKGIKHTFSEKAVVEWELQPDICSTFRRFAAYSRSGMKAGLAQDWQSRVTRVYFVMAVLLAGSWFWAPLSFIPVILFLLRVERRIYRWYTWQSQSWWSFEVLNPRRVLTVACINFVIDVAMFLGVCEWILSDRVAGHEETGVQKNGRSPHTNH